MCGAMSYRQVIARDDRGAMRPSGLYQCSGCSLVFSHHSAWRSSDARAVVPEVREPMRTREKHRLPGAAAD